MSDDIDRIDALLRTLPRLAYWASMHSPAAVLWEAIDLGLARLVPTEGVRVPCAQPGTHYRVDPLDLLELTPSGKRWLDSAATTAPPLPT